MFVTLRGKNGSILAEKCTYGNLGQPFLTDNRENITVPFDPIHVTQKIEISFRDGKPGQIRSLSLEGLEAGKFI